MTTQIVLRSNSQMRDYLDTLRRALGEVLDELDDRTRITRMDPEGIDFYETVARFEADLITSALEVAGGRQNHAARLLNMRRSTLNAKMKALNLR